MGKTLKQIDEDILARLKRVHALVTRWSMMTKEEFDEGRIDEYHYEQTGDIRQHIEMELRTIFQDVMEEESVDAYIKKLNEQIGREFG